MSCASGAKKEDKEEVDVEDVVPKRGKGGKIVKSTDIRAYAIELSTLLEERMAQNKNGRLNATDYQKATSSLMKRYGIISKSKTVHVYRQLCEEDVLIFHQAINNLFIKKLARSAFGGVNLSIFIPPGHTAPIWNIKVIHWFNGSNFL